MGLFNHQRKAKTRTTPSIIRDLLFAVDAALVATSIEETQDLVDRLSNARKAFRLTLVLRKVAHQPKSIPKQVKGIKQQQPAHKSPNTPIVIDGKNLKYVKSFTYLGSKINASASLDDEIFNRISKATDSFGKFRHSSQCLSSRCPFQPPLYGSESWTPYGTYINQLTYSTNDVSVRFMVTPCAIRTSLSII